jgi:aryl-alcohol dehydrogenase-like predicted oxidoreductase
MSRKDEALATAPKYDPVKVGAVLLHEIVEQHPTCLTVEGLGLRIVGDPEDEREIETVLKAIRELRESGLVRYEDVVGIVEPTQAALHAYSLLVE